jgi:hypothetical protein
MAIVDSQGVAHDLERQAGVLMDTRWIAAASIPPLPRRPSCLLSRPSGRSALRPAIADPTPAFDDDGDTPKTLC